MTDIGEAMGACRFCGTVQMVEGSTIEEKNEKATSRCDCMGALAYKNEINARKIINCRFGEFSEDFKNTLTAISKSIMFDDIESVSMKINGKIGTTKCTIKVDNKGRLIILRYDTLTGEDNMMIET